MMNKIKKLMACAALSALCLTSIAPSIVNAAPLGSRVEVTVNSTLIDVTITPSLVVGINPATNTFTPTGTLNVQNNSVAPIKVSLVGITPQVGGPSGYAAFNLVSPDKYSDWSKLNKTESKDIALKLTAGSGWKAAPSDYRSGTSDSFVGTLAPVSVGSIAIGQMYFGRSYETSKTTAFDFEFAVELE